MSNEVEIEIDHIVTETDSAMSECPNCNDTGCPECYDTGNQSGSATSAATKFN